MVAGPNRSDGSRVRAFETLSANAVGVEGDVQPSGLGDVIGGGAGRAHARHPLTAGGPPAPPAWQPQK